MDKKKIEIIATSLLIVIFILVSISSFKKVKKAVSLPKPAAASQNIEPVQGALPTLSPGLNRKSVEAKVYKDWGRDPFSGVVYSVEGKDITLKFTGVLWDESNPQALINGKIVGNNSRVGKYTVIKISKDSVILNDGLKDLELRLGQ